MDVDTGERDEARRRIDALAETYVQPARPPVPLVHRAEAAALEASQAWRDGCDTEALRCMATLQQLHRRMRDARTANYLLLRDAARASFASAARWRARFARGDRGARLYFLARTEVASRFARALCELAEELLGPELIAA
ncbi:MAG TPA: hypothetical protein RMH99_32000 [Sandaracinaceae bacterium LLY-WYZ-13_1]|nr:hypothetical protein [Sandaracinaceae bacterium LLY-WYZ-13_1]